MKITDLNVIEAVFVTEREVSVQVQTQSQLVR